MQEDLTWNTHHPCKLGIDMYASNSNIVAQRQMDSGSTAGQSSKNMGGFRSNERCCLKKVQIKIKWRVREKDTQHSPLLSSIKVLEHIHAYTFCACNTHTRTHTHTVHAYYQCQFSGFNIELQLCNSTETR